MGTSQKTTDGYRIELSPGTQFPLSSHSKFSSFIQTIDEHFEKVQPNSSYGSHWLAMEWCHEPSHVFLPMTKTTTADRIQNAPPPYIVCPSLLSLWDVKSTNPFFIKWLVTERSKRLKVSGFFFKFGSHSSRDKRMQFLFRLRTCFKAKSRRRISPTAMRLVSVCLSGCL